MQSIGRGSKPGNTFDQSIKLQSTVKYGLKESGHDLECYPDEHDFEPPHFVELFAAVGHPSLPPWQLALVTVLQFRETLSDRQAAEAVRSRIDWKYLLGLEITDEGFDFTVLGEFRKRLIAGKQEHLLLDKLLQCCKENGLIKPCGKQRTDATRVLAAVRKLNRLELVGETMRAALNELATVAPSGYQLLHPKPGRPLAEIRAIPLTSA